MSGNTFLVIGSNSFSGGWMVDVLLADNPHNRVIGMSRSPEKSALFLPYKARKTTKFHFHQININSDVREMFELLDEIRPEYIMNFAAQGEVATSWLYPEQWFQTNTVGIVRLANFLKDKDYLKRYVHISTPEVYGTCQGVTESAPLKPSTPYAASKAAGDLYLSTLVMQYDFPLITIRSTNVYGRHQQLYRIIPRTIIFLKSGRKIHLHGGGAAVKSYIHIHDVCRGILAAARDAQPGSIYHFSPDGSISIRELVEQICLLMGYDFNDATEDVQERPGQDSRYIIDSSKARKELSWRPIISLQQGLAEMIDWVSENFDKLVNEPLEYVHLP